MLQKDDTIKESVLGATPQAELSKDKSDEDADLMARQFVTFEVAKEIFALPMACVREIIRMTELVKVPLAPQALEGLANLRGKVLPIINLRQCFHFEKEAHSEATRVIVVDTGVQAGLVVDKVASVMTVEMNQIEAVEAIESTIDSHLLTGMLKNVGKHEMIMLLDATRLIESEFSCFQNKSSHKSTEIVNNTSKDADSLLASTEIQLVSFSVAEQEYAFPMERVQEIVQIPESLCHVPKARSYVLGVMTLRNRLLPIVSLRQMFNLPSAPLDEHNRIVVIGLSVGGQDVSVGIVMDHVKEVLRLSRDCVDSLPGILAKGNEVQEIDAICRLENGKRLVSIISVEKLFQHQAFSEATDVHNKENEEAMTKDDTVQKSGTDIEEQMVVFKLGNEEYAVSVDSVQEILRLPEQFTHVPKALTFIEGLISLRGSVLPVIDLRRRFSMESKERDERQRIMVFTIQGMRTGMIVDAVSEVLKIARSGLEAAPNLSEEQGKMIHLVANLEKQKRMLLVLDINALLSQSEMAALQSNVSKQKN